MTPTSPKVVILTAAQIADLSATRLALQQAKLSKPRSPTTGQDVVVLNPKKLARIREGRGMTQYKLAEISGVSRSFISDLERGRRVSRRFVAEALARALRVDVTVLQDGIADRTSRQAWQ